MSDDTDTTQWSLPGPPDMPRDELQMQLEVYKETILLRGFDGDSAWVRTVGGRDRQRVHPAPWLLLRAAAPGDRLVEPGGDRAGGGPLAAAAGLVRGPATGGVQAPRPAPASHAGAGLRLLAGSRPLGLRRARTGRPTLNSTSSGPLPSTSSGTGGSVPGSHRFPEEVGLIPEVLLPVLLLAYRRFTRDRSKKHPENLVALWEELNGTTAYPVEDLVPQCTVAHALAVSEGRRGYRYR